MSFDAVSSNTAGTVSGDDDIYPVEQLTATAMLAVAARVAVASSFADLVYRESEIDALWSLADIAARSAALEASPDAAARARLREEIGRAHDLVPHGRCAEAAEILHAAASLLTEDVFRAERR